MIAIATFNTFNFHISITSDLISTTLTVFKSSNLTIYIPFPVRFILKFSSCCLISFQLEELPLAFAVCQVWSWSSFCLLGKSLSPLYFWRVALPGKVFLVSKFVCLFLTLRLYHLTPSWHTRHLPKSTLLGLPLYVVIHFSFLLSKFYLSLTLDNLIIMSQWRFPNVQPPWNF